MAIPGRWGCGSKQFTCSSQRSIFSEASLDPLSTFSFLWRPKTAEFDMNLIPSDSPLLLCLPPWTVRCGRSICPTGRCVHSRCRWPQTRCTAHRNSPLSLRGRKRASLYVQQTMQKLANKLVDGAEHLWRCCDVPCISWDSRPHRCGWSQTGRCPHRCNWPTALHKQGV